MRCLASRWHVAALVVLGSTVACKATYDSSRSAPTSTTRRIVVEIDEQGLRVLPFLVQTRRAQPKVLPTLRYEFRDAGGHVLAHGLVPDVRQQLGEVFRAPDKMGWEKLGPALVEIEVPDTTGELVLLPDDPDQHDVIGQAHLESGVLRQQLLTSDDVVGGPVLVSGSGNKQRGVNVVVLSEGYREDELETYRQDVQRMVKEFLTGTEFGDYANDISIWRFDVRSRESGVDDPEQGITRDTAFDEVRGPGCAFPAGEGWAKAKELAERVAPAALGVLLVNDTKYFACAGGILSISRQGALEDLVYPADRGDLLAHELGHALLGLADEYGGDNCSPTAPHMNVSLTGERTRLPWASLVAPSTAVPTPYTATVDELLGGSTVGAYESAQYCNKGRYRSQVMCRMRWSHTSFCRVCRTQLERYFAALPTCGNSSCEPFEDCLTCSQDCGACTSSCGDGTCSSDENYRNCPYDCGTCPAHCEGGICTCTLEASPQNLCAPQTCSAGCCSEGTCLPFAQQSTSACGTGGESCVACDAEQSCQSGACSNAPPPSCGSGTCNGCCADDQCIALDAQSASSCGENGASCTSCSSGASCQQGRCTGAGYDLRLESASRYNFTGAPCGLLGCCASGCDSYLTASVGERGGQSTYRWNDEDPTWHEVLISDLSEATLLSGFSGKLMDRNAPLGDWEICAFTFTPTQAQLLSGSFEVDCLREGFAITRFSFSVLAH